MNSKSIVVVVAVISAVVGALATTALRKADDVKSEAVVADVPAMVTVDVTFHMNAPQDGIATTHAGDKPLPLERKERLGEQLLDEIVIRYDEKNRR